MTRDHANKEKTVRNTMKTESRNRDTVIGKQSTSAMYTIGQVSRQFGLPVSTLRYYDREGLFPDLERSSGIRMFSEKEIDALRMIECLKRSGLEIREIRLFMQWCAEGPKTYPKRKALFEARKEALEAELQMLQKNLAMLQFKCWYYDQAILDGTEERVQKLIPDGLPEEIRALYMQSHDVC